MKSVKEDLRVDTVLHLRIFVYGGVGGVAIHVGVGGGDAMGIMMVVVSTTGVTEEEVDSLWICKDKLAAGVPMGEAAIEGKAHISTFFEWASFKLGFKNMEMASSSVMLMGLRKRGEGIFAGDERGYEITCIARNAESRQRSVEFKGRK